MRFKSIVGLIKGKRSDAIKLQNAFKNIADASDRYDSPKDLAKVLSDNSVIKEYNLKNNKPGKKFSVAGISITAFIKCLEKFDKKSLDEEAYKKICNNFLMNSDDCVPEKGIESIANKMSKKFELADEGKGEINSKLVNLAEYAYNESIADGVKGRSTWVSSVLSDVNACKGVAALLIKIYDLWVKKDNHSPDSTEESTPEISVSSQSDLKISGSQRTKAVNKKGSKQIDDRSNKSVVKNKEVQTAEEKNWIKQFEESCVEFENYDYNTSNVNDLKTAVSNSFIVCSVFNRKVLKKFCCKYGSHGYEEMIEQLRAAFVKMNNFKCLNFEKCNDEKLRKISANSYGVIFSVIDHQLSVSNDQLLPALKLFNSALAHLKEVLNLYYKVVLSKTDNSISFTELNNPSKTDNSISFTELNNPSKTGNSISFTGLNNPMNRCYLNTALQNLVHIEKFRNKVLSVENIEELENKKDYKELVAVYYFFNRILGKVEENEKKEKEYEQNLGYYGKAGSAPDAQREIEHACREQMKKLGKIKGNEREGIEHAKNISEDSIILSVDNPNDKWMEDLIVSGINSRENVVALKNGYFGIHVGAADVGFRDKPIKGIKETLDLGTFLEKKGGDCKKIKFYYKGKEVERSKLKFDLMSVIICNSSRNGKNEITGHYYTYQKEGSSWKEYNDKTVKDESFENILHYMGTQGEVFMYKLRK